VGLQELAWIGSITGSAIGAVTFGFSFYTARSQNQQALRERLRKQLRKMALVSHVHLKRDGWEAINPQPQVSLQELDHIRQDGLLSPSLSHIERLKSIIHAIRELSLHLDPRRGGTATAMFEADRAIKLAFETLDVDADKYLRALGKMDNAGLGGYWTYLRYKFVRASPYSPARPSR
jgi:hypothetical protein